MKEDNTALPSQESVVREIKLHPDYDPRRIHYNLAILVTEYNFVYQRHIGPVCLPEPNESFDNRQDCWSSGWGADSSDLNQGLFSDTLKKIDMPIVPQSRCRNIFRKNNYPSSRVHPSWLCVGGVKDKDTCKGDGGSPHVCFNKDNRYVLVSFSLISSRKKSKFFNLFPLTYPFSLEKSRFYRTSFLIRLGLYHMELDVEQRFLPVTVTLLGPCVGLTM